jgi:hypothetical protein
LVLVGFLFLMIIFDRRRLRRFGRHIAIALVLAVVIAAPLALYLTRNKAVQTRVYEVDAPLRALLAGDPHPVLANVPRVLGMFFWRGDHTARNNLPERPVFAGSFRVSAWAVLFLLGLVVAVRCFRDPRFGLLWVWLLVMLSPSVVTIEAPNFVRTLGALPATMLLLGIGAEAVWRLVSLGRRGLRVPVAFVFTVSLVLTVASTVQDYFVRWPLSSEVAFVWQWDLLDVAVWLDANDAVDNVTVGGLSVRSMDAPTLDLLMRREDVAVRWCDTGSPIGSAGALLFPAGGDTVLIPAVVPVSETLTPYLESPTKIPQSGPATFARYVSSPPDYLSQPLAIYEDGTALLAIDLPVLRSQPGEVVTALSIWRAQGDVHPDLKAYVHLVDDAGTLWAQHDGLDCPAQFWRDGDLIVQVHFLQLPADMPVGTYTLTVGLYDRRTLTPYVLPDGSSGYEIGTLEVDRG